MSLHFCELKKIADKNAASLKFISYGREKVNGCDLERKRRLSINKNACHALNFRSEISFVYVTKCLYYSIHYEKEACIHLQKCVDSLSKSMFYSTEPHMFLKQYKMASHF